MAGGKRPREYMNDMRALRDVLVQIASDGRTQNEKLTHFAKVYPDLARDKPGLFMVACREPADPAMCARLMDPFIDRDDGKISDEEATRRYCRIFMARDMPHMLSVIEKAEEETGGK